MIKNRMMRVSESVVDVGQIFFHYKRAGPRLAQKVILLHGFPETSYSWRHQIQVLSDQGFDVIAFDQRGYGKSSKPSDPNEYNLVRLTDDVVGVMDALGVDKAFVVGHDWGANVAWFCAFRYPERFDGVVGLSVPYGVPLKPVSNFGKYFGPDFYYIKFQKYPEAEILLNDVRSFMIAIFLGTMEMSWPIMEKTLGDVSAGNYTLPDWITEEDIDHYTEQFSLGGLTGPLNWYRCTDLNAEILSDDLKCKGYKIGIPSLYIGGTKDLPFLTQTYHLSEKYLDNHLGSHMLNSGHFMQEEQPEQVSEILINFFRTVKPSPKL